MPLLLAAGCGRGARLEPGPYTALGQVSAQETSNLLNGSGTVVMLVSEADYQSASSLGLAAKTYVETLEKTTRVRIVATEKIATPALALSGVEPLPASKFLELVAKHASADAIVSFVGVPRLSSAQAAQLPPQRPKIVVAATFGPPPRAMFSLGILHLAILSEPAGNESGPKPTTTREWFDANFRLITVQTAHTLPL